MLSLHFSMALAPSKLESKLLQEVLTWLRGEGFSEAVVELFRDQQLDGHAIGVGLSTSPGPDWLKDVVPQLGVRLKVHQALRQAMQCNTEIDMGENSPPQPDNLSAHSGSTVVLPSSMSFDEADLSYPFGSFKLPSAKPRAQLPSPFPIPVFCKSAQAALDGGVLKEADRKYVVQTLATILMTHVQRPSLSQCGFVAKALIDKYPPLNEGGDGEHAWKWFIYHHCHNVNRNLKSEASAPKKPKLERQARLYPPIHSDDDTSVARNLELLKAELKRPKLRMEVAKELMRCTFSHRWSAYLNSKPSSLKEYLAEYPLLKKSTFVIQEFSLVTQKPELRENFDQHFEKWCNAIIVYCKEARAKTTACSTLLSSFSDDTDEGIEKTGVLALSLLSVLFSSKTKSSAGGDIPHFLKCVPLGTPPAEAIEAGNSQPHIVLFLDDEEYSEYLISIEQEVMLKSVNLPTAVYLCVAAHYVFNLTYHKNAKDVFYFLQEKMIGLESTTKKMSSVAAFHTNGITQVFGKT